MQAENESLIWHKLFASEIEAKEKIKLNKMKSFRVGLKKICLLHNQNGLFALEDACPHKMVALSQGTINEKGQIVCFWHQYTFEAKTGKECTGKNIRSAKTFLIRSDEQGFFIGLPEEKERDEFSF